MSKAVLPSGPQGTNRMQVEKHDGSRWNKTNTQEIKISLYSPEPDPRRRQDRLPGAAMLTGSPLPELLPRGLVEQGRPALETLRLPFATSVVGVWRSVFAFVLAGGFRFLFCRVSTKNSQVGFFNNTPIFFSFFVGFGSSRGAWAGIGCVWAHPLFRSRENLCQRSDFISKFFYCAQYRTEVHRQHRRQERERERS